MSDDMRIPGDGLEQAPEQREKKGPGIIEALRGIFAGKIKEKIPTDVPDEPVPRKVYRPQAAPKAPLSQSAIEKEEAMRLNILDCFQGVYKRIKDIPGIILEGEVATEVDSPKSIDDIDLPSVKIIVEFDDGTLMQNDLGWNYFDKDNHPNPGVYLGYMANEWREYKGNLTTDDVPLYEDVEMPFMGDSNLATRPSLLIKSFQEAMNKKELKK